MARKKKRQPKSQHRTLAEVSARTRRGHPIPPDVQAGLDRAWPPLKEALRSAFALLDEVDAMFLDKLFEQRRDADSGRRQRAAGQSSPGRRGQHRVPPVELRALVQAFHKAFPRMSWDKACASVAEGKSVDSSGLIRHGAQRYKSVEMVRRATRDLKWPRARRQAS